MTSLDIAQQRLHNQLITQRPFEKPGDVVEWLGAVQAQDYAAAKWAVGLRCRGVTDDDIEQAFADGAILRTHVMRPTWHFVSPADILWMLALTAPRVKAVNASWYRKLELDDALFRSSTAVLAKALQGGKQLTRAELVSVLKRAGIAIDDVQRFTALMMHAELDGIVCSGARRGKQFTYALLAERAPQARMLDREEALAELARRYFTSHGPATIQDFVWWSGLTGADSRAGLAMVTSYLLHEKINGQTYWFSLSTPPEQDLSQAAYLLPNYDEYTVGYTDRSAIFDASHTDRLDPRGGLLTSTMVLDGQVIGTWKRIFKKNTVVIEASPFVPLSTTETRAFAISANRYGEFLHMPVDSPWQAE
jgi:hypothetical protein